MPLPKPTRHRNRKISNQQRYLAAARATSPKHPQQHSPIRGLEPSPHQARLALLLLLGNQASLVQELQLLVLGPWQPIRPPVLKHQLQRVRLVEDLGLQPASEASASHLLLARHLVALVEVWEALALDLVPKSSAASPPLPENLLLLEKRRSKSSVLQKVMEKTNQMKVMVMAMAMKTQTMKRRLQHLKRRRRLKLPRVRHSPSD